VPCSIVFAVLSPIDTLTRKRYRYRAVKKTTENLRQKELKETLARAENELKHTLERVQNLRDLIAVTRKLCGKPPASPDVSASVTMLPQRRRTKTAELANQVADVLRAAGHPMHVKDIVARLAERGQAVIAQNPTATVAVALSRRPDQFEKVSGNTFDLVKKEGSAAQTA
jgi:hypothetical protein